MHAAILALEAPCQAIPVITAAPVSSPETKLYEFCSHVVFNHACVISNGLNPQGPGPGPPTIIERNEV